MTPRLQGPSAGFGKIAGRLAADADGSETNRDLKLAVREPIV